MTIPFDPSIRNSLAVEMKVYDRAGEKSWKVLAAVDTGASTTMVPLEVARLLGYDLEGAESKRIVGVGGVLHAPKIVLGRVDVGSASARGVEAICFDLAGECIVDALVGLTFLTRFDVRLDFEAWAMELRPRAG